jgi:hypothetical protein
MRYAGWSILSARRRSGGDRSRMTMRLRLSRAIGLRYHRSLCPFAGTGVPKLHDTVDVFFCQTTGRGRRRCICFRIRGGGRRLRRFRVPDRGSVNPTPLGGWDCSASTIKWLDGIVQAGRPYCLGLQVPLGVDNKVSLSSARGRCRGSVPRITT